MNKRETPEEAQTEPKKNLEKYIASHPKRGENFWNKLIEKEKKEIIAWYDGLIAYYDEEAEKIGTEKDKIEFLLEKIDIKRQKGRATEEDEKKEKELDQKVDELENKIDRLEEMINKLNAKKEEIVTFVKHRDRDFLPLEEIKKMRMETPPDEAIEDLRRAIKIQEGKIHQTMGLKDLEEMAQFWQAIIDIYIILKLAEKIF